MIWRIGCSGNFPFVHRFVNFLFFRIVDMQIVSKEPPRSSLIGQALYLCQVHQYPIIGQVPSLFVWMQQLPKRSSSGDRLSLNRKINSVVVCLAFAFIGRNAGRPPRVKVTMTLLVTMLDARAGLSPTLSHKTPVSYVWDGL